MQINLTPWQLYNLILNGMPQEITRDQIVDEGNGQTALFVAGTNDARIQDFFFHSLLNRLLSPLDVKIDTGARLYGLRKKVTQTPEHELILEDM